MPKEEVELHLEYFGRDVDDGTMALEDLVPVLQGFSSAYGKIAAADDPGTRHRIRIVAVRQGSADLVLEVWRILGENVDSLTGASIVAGGAWFIFKKIVDLIRLKRHVRKQPYRERIGTDNSILVFNVQNVNIEVSLEIFELFKSGVLDADLAKIVRPLELGRIDKAELRAEAPGRDVLSETINADERGLFDTPEVNVTSTNDARLLAHLNSLTKTTNSGYLYLADGTRVFYKYVGEDAPRLHEIFAHDGPVHIQAVAHLDESLKPTYLEITSVEKAQGELFRPSAPPTADDPGE